MPALFSPEQVYARRNIPGWLLLSLSAGLVNGTAFLGADRFISHLTGVGTHLGFSVGELEVELESVLILAMFVVGSFIAGLLIDGRRQRGKVPLYTQPLWLVVVLLAVGGVLGRRGSLGSFGGGTDEPNFFLLYLLSFAMGMQNSAVSMMTGLAVRTTHITGPATDIGIQLANAVSGRGDASRTAGKAVWLRVGGLSAFVAGGALSVPLCDYLEFATLLVAAALIAAVTVWVLLPQARQAAKTA